MQYVSFYVDDRLYGFDIRIVKEVNTNTDIAIVPRSENHIRGLVNVRGQVVLVLDIAVLFGHEPRPVREESQIVILKTAQEIMRIQGFGCEVDARRFGDRPVGILVDRISDVVAANEDEVELPPPHLTESDARFVQGVIRLEELLLLILDAGEML